MNAALARIMGLRKRARRLHDDLAELPGGEMAPLGRCFLTATACLLEAVEALDEAAELLAEEPS